MRRKSVILFICSVFSILCLSSCSNSSSSIEPNSNITDAVTQKTYYSNNGNNKIIITGIVTEETQILDRINESLSFIIPEKLANACTLDIHVLDDDNFKIEYEKRDDVEGKSSKSSAGFLKSVDNKPVGIFLCGGYTDQSKLYVICHELGHYFDYVLGYPSSSKEFAKITEEESAKLMDNNRYANSNGYYSNPTEFFAESFASYVIANYYSENDSNYQYDSIYKCTQTVEHISSLIESYEQN